MHATAFIHYSPLLPTPPPFPLGRLIDLNQDNLVDLVVRPSDEYSWIEFTDLGCATEMHFLKNKVIIRGHLLFMTRFKSQRRMMS